MAIQLDGVLAATTMHPGPRLRAGRGLLPDGGAAGRAPVESVRYCATGSATETDFNVVTVETGGARRRRRGSRRPRRAAGSAAPPSSTSCSSGWTLPASRNLVAPESLADLAGAALAGSPCSTRRVRCTAVAFDVEGSAVVAREDVGRHKARSTR